VAELGVEAHLFVLVLGLGSLAFVRHSVIVP
jgi:hypothetical protein